MGSLWVFGCSDEDSRRIYEVNNEVYMCNLALHKDSMTFLRGGCFRKSLKSKD